MFKNLVLNRQIQVCAALIAADCLVFTLVDPVSASATWLFSGYVLLGLTLFALARLLAEAFKSYGRRTYGLSKRLMYYGAATVVTLIGLQSVGQLTVRDVTMMAAFAVLAYLYISYDKKMTAEMP